MSISILAEPAITNRIFLIKLSMIFSYIAVLILTVRDFRAQKAIRDAIQEWTSRTCIRFKRVTTETAYAFFVPGKG